LVLAHSCPACGTAGCFGKHAVYQKYHFAQRIDIQRVRCQACGTTHAMIPRFSVPGTSLGTEEAEASLLSRSVRTSRREAGAGLVEQGMEGRTGRRVEKMLDTAVARAKAIWPRAATPSLHGLGWIAAVCGRVDHPIVDLNRWALAHGVNAICFCRSSILFFPARQSAGAHSHNPASPAGIGSAVTVAIAPGAQGGSP
jgi:hypothetical protein